MSRVSNITITTQAGEHLLISVCARRWWQLWRPRYELSCKTAPPKKPTQWHCRRCKADVINFRCECATSPSPWEPKP